MVEVSKFKLGLFVIITLSLLAAALFVLGVAERFSPKGRLVPYFTESVQGVDIGSAVKFKGVPIGRVSAIYIETKDKNIRVDMDVDLRAFSISPDNDLTMTPNNFYEFCRNERALGLRCRLDYGGLTGLKYVELDYFADALPENSADFKLSGKNLSGRFYVPSIKSTLTDILGKFNRSLEKISAVDFEGISRKLTTALTDFSALVSDENIKKSLSKLSVVSGNLEQISTAMADSITEESVKELMANLDGTLREVNILSAKLVEQVETARLSDTSASVRNSALAFERLQRELGNTVLKLNDTLEAVSGLAESLSDDPNSLVFGKNIKPLKNE